jgi:hypothetical protein
VHRQTQISGIAVWVFGCYQLIQLKTRFAIQIGRNQLRAVAAAQRLARLLLLAGFHL